MKKTIAGLLVCFTAAIACGDADELFRQGAALFKSEPAKAYPLFLQAAEEGNVSAMVGAGHCLENGIGTETDYARAIEWYEMAAAQNNLKACQGLARIYASCPDPQFHDGALALENAGAVVRKKPKDAEALSLLAAAHARNFEFGKAVRNAKQATFYVHDDEAKNTILREIEGYGLGRPCPAMATEAWMVAAAGSGQSIWAADRALWRFCERGGPYYNPEKAIEICQLLLENGQMGIYRELTGLYVDTMQFKKAYRCIERLRDHYSDQHIMGKMNNGVVRSMWTLDKLSGGELSTDELFVIAKKWDEGFLYSASYRDPETGSSVTSSRHYDADPATAYLLYRAAALLGDAEASIKVGIYVKKMAAYRAILENEPNLSTEEVARDVAEEARKVEEGKELPRSILMAIGLYWEAYMLDPSPEYETAIERLVETLSL